MNKRALANAAKSAWEKAIQDKKDAAEQARLKAEYDRLEAEAVAEEKAAGGAGGNAGGTAGGAAGATKELTIEEVSTLLVTSVKAALKEMLPAEATKSLTEEQVKKIVTDAFAAQFPADANGKTPKITEEGIKSVVQDVMTKQVNEYKRASKMQFAGGDDGSRGGQIEIPYGLSKGNLPLHMKQLLNVLMNKPQDDGVDAALLDRGRKMGDQMFLGMKTQGVKALTTGGTGTGAEWIPRDLSSELYRRLYLDSDIAQSFMASEIEMPSDPYDVPLLTLDPTFYLNTAQNTDAAASNPGTGKFTLTTQRLMALVQYSYESDEDSIIPILPTLQMQLARAGARALENALINGDTAATHQDSDVTDPKDQAKAWNGFRKLALAVAGLKLDISTGGISRANLTSLLKLLGKWGARTSDLMWIIGSRTWSTMLGLDEFALAYARGATPTFAGQGTLSSPYGGTITRSEMAREVLNASGVYDGVTVTKGAVLLINKTGFLMGSRRDFMVETFRNIRSQTNDIVASFRKAFQPVETPSATITTCAVAYNYAA